MRPETEPQASCSTSAGRELVVVARHGVFQRAGRGSEDPAQTGRRGDARPFRRAIRPRRRRPRGRSRPQGRCRKPAWSADVRPCRAFPRSGGGWRSIRCAVEDDAPAAGEARRNLRRGPFVTRRIGTVGGVAGPQNCGSCMPSTFFVFVVRAEEGVALLHQRWEHLLRLPAVFPEVLR